jgi:hypothetical protein
MKAWTEATAAASKEHPNMTPDEIGRYVRDQSPGYWRPLADANALPAELQREHSDAVKLTKQFNSEIPDKNKLGKEDYEARLESLKRKYAGYEQNPLTKLLEPILKPVKPVEGGSPVGPDRRSKEQIEKDKGNTVIAPDGQPVVVASPDAKKEYDQHMAVAGETKVAYETLVDAIKKGDTARVKQAQNQLESLLPDFKTGTKRAPGEKDEKIGWIKAFTAANIFDGTALKNARDLGIQLNQRHEDVMKQTFGPGVLTKTPKLIDINAAAPAAPAAPAVPGAPPITNPTVSPSFKGGPFDLPKLSESEKAFKELGGRPLPKVNK